MIDTQRLTLRPLTLDDAPFYLKLLNEPSFLENIGDKGVRDLDGARAAMLAGPIEMQARLGYSLWLVLRKEDGAAIGMCGLIKRDTLPGTDIGYAYLPDYWGQGYAWEAASAALAYGRDVVGLPFLLGIVSPSNTASSQLLRKLGMHYVERIQPTTDLYRMEFPPHNK
ncbi:GNAT family N-acetyltransferase [Pseudoduganella sp. DS3]|uniref:GNAT family N-acetyltransferase n=1 Tax=Pseudoduganella guangdongensis TaxID=2692179 RepID=A0A6N9HE27_9BURK|nr:GNAT family N-acetyltransferase [Pseudoduganella guangdongensis]MYN01670.1 GNAT family N-acetyltransferase [Pseudoduganella guangdongensis]